MLLYILPYSFVLVYSIRISGETDNTILTVKRDTAVASLIADQCPSALYWSAHMTYKHCRHFYISNVF
jgi:hypothetical protein